MKRYIFIRVGSVPELRKWATYASDLFIMTEYISVEQKPTTIQTTSWQRVCKELLTFYIGFSSNELTTLVVDTMADLSLVLGAPVFSWSAIHVFVFCLLFIPTISKPKDIIHSQNWKKTHPNTSRRALWWCIQIEPFKGSSSCHIKTMQCTILKGTLTILRLTWRVHSKNGIW